MPDFSRDIEDMLRREYRGDFPEERQIYEELRKRVEGLRDQQSRQQVDDVDRDSVEYLSVVEDDFENYEAELEAEQEE